MTAARFSEQLASPITWLPRALQTMLPTSAETELDIQPPTDLRYAPPATNDRQGSTRPGMVRRNDASLAVQPNKSKDIAPLVTAQITPGTAGDRLDPALAALTAAAEAQDELAFLAAYHAVDWAKRDAALFETAIHLAFAAGAHMAARLLATQGAALHPDSDYLRRADYVLAPPKVIGRRPASNGGNAANKAWMMANRAAYRGRWVALRNGELLDSGSKLEELVNRFGAVPEILYTRVT